MLAALIEDLPARSRLFELSRKTARAIRADLKAAAIDYETDDGFADFHSLRAFYVSALVASGASIKEVQTLARHAQPQTTLSHYAKVSAHDLRRAIETADETSPHEFTEQNPRHAPSENGISPGIPAMFSSEQLAPHLPRTGVVSGHDVAIETALDDVNNREDDRMFTVRNPLSLTALDGSGRPEEGTGVHGNRTHREPLSRPPAGFEDRGRHQSYRHSHRSRMRV